jgi:mRNA interferase MazF
LSPRLGNSVGFLSFDEMRRVDAALRIVLDL